MNLPGTPIQLSLIDRNPKQPRTIFTPIEGMAEHGQRAAIIVAKRGKRYLLVDGERRHRTAEQLGWQEIGCDVRVMTDEEIDLAFLDFASGEPLSPLDEAAYIDRLRTERGWSVAELAIRLSRADSYVRKSIVLHSLHSDIRELVRAGSVNASDALLLARVSGTDQAKAAAALKASTWVSGGQVVPRAFIATHTQRYMMALADPGFDTDDNSMPGGACVACPKRTGNQTLLAGFADVCADDRCTDAVCFSGKLDTVWSRTIERWPDAARLEGTEARKALTQIANGQGWREAADGERPTAIIRGPEGRTLRLVALPQKPAAPAAAAQPTIPNKPKRDGLTAAERELLLEQLLENPTPAIVVAGLEASGMLRREWLEEIREGRELEKLSDANDWGIVVEIVGMISDDALRAMARLAEAMPA